MTHDQDYIRKLAVEAYDTVDLLSSRRKGERERRVAAAFLRCLGVDFLPQELVNPKSDPPDVIFRDAQFEVMIVLDEERRMHADWIARASRLDSANGMKELLEPYRPSAPMDLREIVDRIESELARKASRYDMDTRSELDVLVYVNLLRRHLDPRSIMDMPAQRRSLQDWRSVSLVFPPYAHVISATPKAPGFLCSWVGHIRQECRSPDAMFEL